MSFLTAVSNYTHAQNDNCRLVPLKEYKTANLHMMAKYFAMMNISPFLIILILERRKSPNQLHFI